MIILKNDEQIQKMYVANQIVKQTLELLEKNIKPGISTKKLDEIAEEFIRNQNAIPNFKNYGGFPASICTSVNDVVVHGIPSKKRVLKEGDIVSLDCGCIYKGYHSDAARTYAVGSISPEVQKLLDVTKQSFFEGIKMAKAGNHLYDISNAIDDYVV